MGDGEPRRGRQPRLRLGGPGALTEWSKVRARDDGPPILWATAPTGVGCA